MKIVKGDEKPNYYALFLALRNGNLITLSTTPEAVRFAELCQSRGLNIKFSWVDGMWYLFQAVRGGNCA